MKVCRGNSRDLTFPRSRSAVSCPSSQARTPTCSTGSLGDHARPVPPPLTRLLAHTRALQYRYLTHSPLFRAGLLSRARGCVTAALALPRPVAVMWMGGPTEFAKVVAIAQAQGVAVVPHGCGVYGYYMAMAFLTYRF